MHIIYCRLWYFKPHNLKSLQHMKDFQSLFSVMVVQEEVLVHETGGSLIQSHTESYCLISEELDNLLLLMNSGFVYKLIILMKSVYWINVGCTGGVVVSMLSLSAVDSGFEPWPGQTKDNKIGISCFSAKHATFKGERTKTGGLGIRIICQSGATCLSADCCFSEVEL